MKLKIKNKEAINLNIDESGIKGFVKTADFELEIDSTWEEIEDRFMTLTRRAPRRARGHVMEYLEQRTQQERN